MDIYGMLDQYMNTYLKTVQKALQDVFVSKQEFDHLANVVVAIMIIGLIWCITLSIIVYLQHKKLKATQDWFVNYVNDNSEQEDYPVDVSQAFRNLSKNMQNTADRLNGKGKK